MGCIRIGTLHDFRELEHKKGIGDPNEGKKTVYHTTKLQQIKSTNDPNVGKSKDFKALKEFGIMHLEDCYDVTIGKMNMARSFDTPNCYILCSSKYPSKETMTEFEGADSCIQIVNIESFYSHLTETLNTITPVIFQGIHEVIYRNDREEQWNGNDWGHRPALLKEMQFKPQG
jgi:hypothetical protein